MQVVLQVCVISVLENCMNKMFREFTASSIFTCSKLIIETEQVVKYVNNKDSRTMPLVSLLLTVNIFHTLL